MFLHLMVFYRREVEANKIGPDSALQELSHGLATGVLCIQLLDICNDWAPEMYDKDGGRRGLFLFCSEDTGVSRLSPTLSLYACFRLVLLPSNLTRTYVYSRTILFPWEFQRFSERCPMCLMPYFWAGAMFVGHMKLSRYCCLYCCCCCFPHVRTEICVYSRFGVSSI